MSIVELWLWLTGGPLKKILAALDRIEKNQQTMSVEARARFLMIDSTLAAIQAQLGRIGSDVGGGNEAVSLVISVGVPTEQESA